MVTDLGSTNGTRLNDVAGQRAAPLREGDVLALGNVRLKVGRTLSLRLRHTGKQLSVRDR